MKSAILAIAETSAPGLHPVSREVLAFADILAECTGLPVTACVVGDAIDEAAKALQNETDHDVIGISIPGLSGYNCEAYVAALSDLLQANDYRFVCAPHSARGIDFAPVLAAKIGAACVTGIEKLEMPDDRLIFTRRVLNGKKVARVSLSGRSAVVTVQPGIFKKEKRSKPSAGKPSMKTFAFDSGGTESLGIKPSRTDAGSLQDADVIVAAGNGIGKPENLDLINRLARQFPRSAVAGSRPVCDRQWLPYARQVGVTGAVVRPRLYIAVGISGASQHIAGIMESGYIVAINKDPNAAIFNFADLCIVEDLTTFTPLLLERLAGSA